jgi:hypothetical protein
MLSSNKPGILRVKSKPQAPVAPGNRVKAMEWPNCNKVKETLTDLKEILVRSYSTPATNGPSRLETAKILANIEATISTIEEKSLASGDFSSDLGVPVVAGLTAPISATA